MKARPGQLDAIERILRTHRVAREQVEKATAGLKLAAKEDIDRLEKKIDKVLGRKR